MGKLVDFGACGARERVCFGLVGSFHPIVKFLVGLQIVQTIWAGETLAGKKEDGCRWNCYVLLMRLWVHFYYSWAN